MLLRQRGQGFRFVQAVAERPFAIDGLARLERRRRQLEVIRHFHCYRDDVHGRAVDELLVIVERGSYVEELSGGVGRFASCGRQRRDLEVVGERPQCGNVRLRRPAAIRIGADDADTNPPGSTHVSRLAAQNPTVCRMRTTWMRPGSSWWISRIFPTRLF